jgi:hypothetical protein
MYYDLAGFYILDVLIVLAAIPVHKPFFANPRPVTTALDFSIEKLCPNLIIASAREIFALALQMLP